MRQPFVAIGRAQLQVEGLAGATEKRVAPDNAEIDGRHQDVAFLIYRRYSILVSRWQRNNRGSHLCDAKTVYDYATPLA